jgi:hypothetical protein
MFSGISSKRVLPRRFVYFVRGTQEGISAYFLRQIERHANAKKVWPGRKQPSAYSKLRGPQPDADNNNIASCAVAMSAAGFFNALSMAGEVRTCSPSHRILLRCRQVSVVQECKECATAPSRSHHCGQSTQRLCRNAIFSNGVRWYLPAAGPAGFRCEGQLSQPIRLSMPTIPCNSALAAIPAD